MLSNFRPLLAYKVQHFEDLVYPQIASPKIDGIRCVFFDKALSRTLKPIRNKYVQKVLAQVSQSIYGFDGELIVPGGFSAVSSAIMSEDGQPDFKFQVFDLASERYKNAGYVTRYDCLRDTVKFLNHPNIELVEQNWISNAQDLTRAEIRALQAGYEGLMVRHPKGIYKYGRSTVNEGYLGKIKRFMDAEAEIVGFEPLYTNENERARNALGLTERASNKENLREKPLLGALQCRNLKDNRTFAIGTGFTSTQRTQFWNNAVLLLGQIVRFIYLPYGTLELPRHPVFLGFRDREDIS